MLLRTVFITLIIILSGCNSPSEGEKDGPKFASTGSETAANKGNFPIKGTWVSDQKEEWEFTQNDLHWNGYTHPFYLGKDTLVIGGRPFKYTTTGNDTLRLTPLFGGENVRLVRR